MRHLLFAALLLLCCAYGCVAFGQTKPVLAGSGDSVWGPFVVTGNAPKSTGSEWKPLSIAVDAEQLHNGFLTCKNGGKAGESIENKAGVKSFDKEECEALRSFTMEKAELLLKKVFPVAVGMHSERLSVKRGNDNLIIKSKTETVREPCKSYVPQEHRRTGLPNVDFVVYVGLWNDETSTTICSYDVKSDRPTSAVIRFNVSDLKGLQLSDVKDTDRAVRIVAHEIAHGLGFSTKANAFGRLINATDDGKHMELKSEKIKKVLQSRGCSNMNGIRFDDKSMDKPHPHFDGTIAKDELMSPYNGKENQMRYSNVTLAVFESLGYYQVNHGKFSDETVGITVVCQ